MTPIESLLATAARLGQHASASREHETRILAREAAAAIRGAVASLRRATEQAEARAAKAAGQTIRSAP